MTALAFLGTAIIAGLGALLALRLLGASRGWPTALLAGALGSAGAVVAAVAVSDDRAVDIAIAFRAPLVAVPATMVAAVVIDLVARPGSLASGDQAGLIIIPRPFQAARSRARVVGRYLALIRLLRREGFGPWLTHRQRRTRSADAVATRARRVLEEAGGVYIKLGQLASSRVDLMPAEVCRELGRLDNRAAPEPADQMRSVLETELGTTTETVFAAFDWEPVAAASIGQTYRARLHSGEAVIVKIQRPSVRDTVERDLAALALLAAFVQRRTPIGRQLCVADLHAQFAAQLRAELDFRREADAMTEMAAELAGNATVRVPVVHESLCTMRVIVQERFDGATVADLDLADVTDADRCRLAQQLLRSSIDQILRGGFFHADPHPGNVFVLADGTLGLVDFGAVGRLDRLQQHALVAILAAIGQRNASLLRDGLEQIADIDPAMPPDHLERALARLLDTHVRRDGTVDIAVTQDLVSSLTGLGVRLPAELVMLTRTLITLEGTLRRLAPELSVVEAAAGALTAGGPGAVIDHRAFLRDELVSAIPHLRRIPENIDRLLTLSSRGELRFHTIIDENTHRTARTLVNRALLAAVGITILAVSAFLIVAPGSRASTASPSGVPATIGYAGLLAGVVLVTRVVAAVVRDGTT